MPKIGMRMVKSAVAVFLCFAVYLLRGQGMPFYSAIAAVLCMQPDVPNSIKVALNRVGGTLLGGAAGMLILMAERAFIPRSAPAVQYLLVSLTIIPLIYLTVLLKKPSASYITCVVFMSVAVSHGADVSPYLFAAGRVTDTLIGIAVSLMVNAVRFPLRKGGGLFFVTGLDGVLLDRDGALDSQTKNRLNRMLDGGARITVATSRTPASFLPLLEGVRLKLPVIAMNGAALYYPGRDAYSDCKTIPYETAVAVDALFQSNRMNCFIGAVIHDVLHIFFRDPLSPLEEKLYERSRQSKYQHYVCAALPEARDAVRILAVAPELTVSRLCGALARLPCSDGLNIRTRPCDGQEGYVTLSIYSAEATVESAAFALRERVGGRILAAFGGTEDELALVCAADYGLAAPDAPPALREAACPAGRLGGGAPVAMMERMCRGKRPCKRPAPAAASPVEAPRQ